MKTVWEVLGDRGRRSVVVNDPCSYPPQAIDGWVVSGMTTPAESAGWTHPPELKGELLERVPGYVVDVWYSAEDTHVQVSGKGTPVELRGHSIADTLEWRLAGGKPFAVIMPVTEIEDDAKGQPHLRRKVVLVRGLDAFASTINDQIEGNDEAAVKQARAVADGIYKKAKASKK